MFCTKCKHKSRKGFTFYRIIYTSDVHYTIVSLIDIIDELQDYLEDKFYHLSATQVILFRQDILGEFLAKKCRDEHETLSGWVLDLKPICHICYKNIYTMKYPIR